MKLVEGGREEGREREGGREGGKEGGRERGREGRREVEKEREMRWLYTISKINATIMEFNIFVGLAGYEN